jgi:hypothetical protein
MNGAPRANTAPRKSQNQQLDRLDQILDGLAGSIIPQTTAVVLDRGALAAW